MKLQRRLIVCAAMCGVLLSAARANPAPQESRAAAKEGIPWRTDLAAALKEARTTERPLCIVFRCEA